MAENWLEELKAGDEVVVSGPFGRLIVDTVARTTKTQIHLKDGYYRRKDGMGVGPISGCLKPANAQWRRLVRHRELEDYIQENVCRLRDVPIAALEQIVEAMKQAESEER